MNEKAIVAMSGGVDSGAAMLLAIKKYGRDNVCGVTLALNERDTTGEESDRVNSADARCVCDALHVPHETLYAYPAFREKVIDYFIEEYLLGRTPNPCVICNREIKFGLLYDYAKSRGFRRIVTGHYARLESGVLRRAADLKKDQSYVLAMLTAAQLAAADFPLGGMTKSSVRALAAEHGFTSAHRSDSQDICFIPDGDYAGFIKKFLDPAADFSGDYVDADGKILGSHRGQWQYTIGQRKGLGIALGKHVFVLAKDAENNRVILGDEAALFQTEIHVKKLNFHLPADELFALDSCSAKIRYAHAPAPVRLKAMSESDGDTLTLIFDTPQRAPTSGQFAVVYHGDAVVCAGEIV